MTIEKSEEVWQRSKDWLLQEAGGKYDYVETELPKVSRTVLLEQTVDENDFDLKGVIRAVNGL